MHGCDPRKGPVRLASAMSIIAHPYFSRADGKHDYFHANYVDGYRERNKFILSQAPMEESLEQFWTMIWNERVVVVVAVTVLDGRRCPKYIPTASGKQICIGPYRITHRGTRHVRDTYDATVLLVSREGLPIAPIHSRLKRSESCLARCFTSPTTPGPTRALRGVRRRLCT